MSNEQPQDTRTASQKIADLENAVLSLLQTTQNMVRDVSVLKETLKLLNGKTSAIAKAVAGGHLPTDDVISKFMIEANIEELKQKVTDMVNQGSLTPQDQTTEESFIVGQEENDAGEIVNPRVQFAVFAIKERDPALAAKFIGAKPGDLLALEEGKLKFRVGEAYLIQAPKAEAEAPAAALAPAPEAAAPAPADAPAPASQPDASATPAN